VVRAITEQSPVVVSPHRHAPGTVS
jgi:hypothetical protein